MPTMTDLQLRRIRPEDRHEVADLIYASINSWYATHGNMFQFKGGPAVTDVFYEVYDALEPGCAVVAQNARTGRLMGSCFFHPRKHHVSLGIMNVHPNYFGMQVGRSLLQYIIDFTEQQGYPALRLTSSALNLDSFSLYNRAGFVPRCAFQDMVVKVPATGLTQAVPGTDRVRPATLADVPALAALELEVSGIVRVEDYAYGIANALGCWHMAVYENPRGDIDGFLLGCGHPAMNMLGPLVARTEYEAAALLRYGFDLYPGRTPVCLVPVERTQLVGRLYELGARNCELHFCQVRGAFQPFAGISMPTFLPETG